MSPINFTRVELIGFFYFDYATNLERHLSYGCRPFPIIQKPQLEKTKGCILSVIIEYHKPLTDETI